MESAVLINELFFEVLIGPNFATDALELLQGKKNRIILKSKSFSFPTKQVRTVLNGHLVQDRDNVNDKKENFNRVTTHPVSSTQLDDLEFANIIVKHTKSNAIVLVKNLQMLASGTGQTSRVDALRQAIHKAGSFKLDMTGAVMASDAFFPFPDCVEIANEAGVKAVIQPGGSIKDQLSIDYCNNNNVAMVFTGNRHFKH